MASLNKDDLQPEERLVLATWQRFVLAIRGASDPSITHESAALAAALLTVALTTLQSR